MPNRVKLLLDDMADKFGLASSRRLETDDDDEDDDSGEFPILPSRDSNDDDGDDDENSRDENDDDDDDDDDNSPNETMDNAMVEEAIARLDELNGRMRGARFAGNSNRGVRMDTPRKKLDQTLYRAMAVLGADADGDSDRKRVHKIVAISNNPNHEASFLGKICNDFCCCCFFSYFSSFFFFVVNSFTVRFCKCATRVV